jgi:hypothetical protein
MLEQCQANLGAIFFSRKIVFPQPAKDVQADPVAFDELVNKWHSRSTATLVIDGEAIIGFNHNRDRIEKLLSQPT